MSNKLKIGVFLLLSLSLVFQCRKDKNEEVKSSEKAILAFSIAQQTKSAVIDTTNHLIIAEVTIGTDLSKIQPEFTLSEKATCIPTSGVSTDFSLGPVIYTVTAEDQSIQEWTVSVTTEKSSAAFILAFTVNSQIGSSEIIDTTINILVSRGTDLSKITPTIIVSPGATVSPESGLVTDFSMGPVTFTVTSENGNTKWWVVNVETEKSSEAKILTFSITNQTGNAVITDTTVIDTMQHGTDLTKIVPTITISPYATISPASAAVVDFSAGPVNYTVTAEDGTIKKYEITVVKLISSSKVILTFSVTNQKTNAVIKDSTVIDTMPHGTDLTKIAPKITVSPYATISPASGAVLDFSAGPVNYTVTAEDGTFKKYKVTIVAINSSAKDILTFKVDTIVGAIDKTLSTVNLKLGVGYDLSKVTPLITVSQYATISPASGVVKDFSAGPLDYTVTAEDGSKQVWKVTVTKTIGTGKEILTFSVPGQVGEITKTTSWITLEVNVSVDLTSIAPTITVSPGATITPASGVPVDFSSGYADYKVTAENGSYRNYKVYINYAKISADNANYQYFGRIDFTNPQKPKLWAAGSYIKAKFTGKYCAIALNDQNRYGRNNYIEYVIDDQTPVRLKTTGTTNNILVSDNLGDGEHTITFCKNTEANIGYIEFLGLRVESLVALPAKPYRKIEFIGNSITCGCGSDISALSCSEGEWFDTDNAYKSYGAELARRLNTQYHLTSAGGIGLIRSCCGMTITMPDVFETIEFNGLDAGRTSWDFTKYVPDVVTISLGQNDGPQASDSSAFCSAYVSFIATIRGHYPDAQIVLLTSPMSKMTMLEKYITSVVDFYNGEGDSKVSKYFFTKNWNGGCNSHPSVAQHLEIADELETYLSTLLGW
jgi:hypothetical protein